MAHALEALRTVFQQRLQSAQSRVMQAQEESMERYYKGQVDTLNIVLQDVDAMKFELGLELDRAESPEEPHQEQQPEPKGSHAHHWHSA